jgi:hypothetical protein
MSRHCGINGRGPAQAGKETVYAAKGLDSPVRRTNKKIRLLHLTQIKLEYCLSKSYDISVVVPLRRYTYEQVQTSYSGGKKYYRTKVNQQGII